jgi:hypothetical protein
MNTTVTDEQVRQLAGTAKPLEQLRIAGVPDPMTSGAGGQRHIPRPHCRTGMDSADELVPLVPSNR